MSKKNQLSTNMIRKAKKAGMPEPITQQAKSNFAKLQKEWYAKLSKSGFEDLEWVDHRTGRGHNSGFLKGSLISGKQYHPGRALYYQLATNYLIHCSNLKNRPYHRFIWKLHSKGLTYDQIEAAVQKKYKKDISKYTIYYHIQDLAKLCYKWNAKHPEGILYKRAEDKLAIEQKGLEEFYAEEYNWIINKDFAAREIANARIQKNKTK